MVTLVNDYLPQAVALWLAVVNSAAFFLMFWDKRQARLHRRRIPERTLLLLAAVGGAPAAIVAMRLFRHKTLHTAFSLGLPVILTIQLVGVCFLVWYTCFFLP